MRHLYSFLRSISPTRTRLQRPEAVVKHVPGPALAWRRLRPPAAPGRGMAGVRNPAPGAAAGRPRRRRALSADLLRLRAAGALRLLRPPRRGAAAPHLFGPAQPSHVSSPRPSSAAPRLDRDNRKDSHGTWLRRQTMAPPASRSSPVVSLTGAGSRPLALLAPVHAPCLTGAGSRPLASLAPVHGPFLAPSRPSRIRRLVA